MNVDLKKANRSKKAKKTREENALKGNEFERYGWLDLQMQISWKAELNVATVVEKFKGK